MHEFLAYCVIMQFSFLFYALPFFCEVRECYCKKSTEKNTEMKEENKTEMKDANKILIKYTEQYRKEAIWQYKKISKRETKTK